MERDRDGGLRRRIVRSVMMLNGYEMPRHMLIRLIGLIIVTMNWRQRCA